MQIGNKEHGLIEARITTLVSLAGSYLTLLPNNPRGGGISRRIEGDERTELQTSLSKLSLPKGMGLIVRIAAKSYDDVERDLDALLHNWTAILDAANSQSAPFLIHQKSQ